MCCTNKYKQAACGAQLGSTTLEIAGAPACLEAEGSNLVYKAGWLEGLAALGRSIPCLACDIEVEATLR